MSQPVWGICRHGLVTGGQLALENGGTLAYTQPGPLTLSNGTVIHETYGHTYKVQAPGTPAITRSPEEAANDLAKGYVWQNSSVLSGASKGLARRSFGTNAWLYTAPDGSRWRVDISSGMSATTPYDVRLARPYTLRLRRFGELLGAAASFSYSGTIADLAAGNNTVNLDRPNIYLMITDFNSDGSRAVLDVYKWVSGSGRPFMYNEQRMSTAFHEFALSGTPGVDFVHSVSLLYSWADIWQEAGSYAGMATTVGWFAGWKYSYKPSGNPLPGGPEWYSAATAPPDVTSYNWAMAPAWMLVAGERIRTASRIVAVWYDSVDAPVPVIVREDSTLTLSISDPSPPTQTSTYSWTSTVQVEWGAVTSVPITETGQNTATWSWPAYVPGESYTVTTSGTQTRDCMGLPPIISTVTAAGSIARAPQVSRVIYTLMTSHGGDFSVTPAKFSNSVIGLSVINIAAPYEMRGIFRPITKSGEADGETYSFISEPVGGVYPFIYGSHNPATGDTVWGSTVPICYV